MQHLSDPVNIPLTLSAPSPILSLLPAKHQASRQSPKLFKAIELFFFFFFFFFFLAKDDFFLRTMEISQKVSKNVKYCEKCLAKNGNFDFFMSLQPSCGFFHRRERVTLQTSCGAERVNIFFSGV